MMLPIPTPQHVEQLRLILSTFQDGSGQQALKPPQIDASRPGWRDFERATALAFSGHPQESKFIFDVLVSDLGVQNQYYGISCKMRRTLPVEKVNTKKTEKIDEVSFTEEDPTRALMELSNSSGKFWDELKGYNLDQKNYRQQPKVVGRRIIELVERWHQQLAPPNGGTINMDKSFYLVLSWNEQGWYQLHQFSLKLPDPNLIQWSFPPGKTRKGQDASEGRHLRGEDQHGKLFEWYGESGGQLKYFPLFSTAAWRSERFQLEPLPEGRYGLRHKAEDYFPEKWAACNP
jgi:hypothetical protein